MKRYVLLFAAALMIVAECSGDRDASRAGKNAVSIAEFAKWEFQGSGEVTVDETEDAVYMSEAEGSAGVTLVSPKSYGPDVTVRFDVKPATFESVNVVILSASDKNTGGDIQVPADYDGSFGFWTQGDVQNYIFAFHNAAHERLPFIVRDPGMELLGEADSHVVKEDWHTVEISRSGSRLSMKVDGAVIVEVTDTSGEPLPGGKIGFRLRGTPDSVASAWFRNIVISER